MWGLFMKKFILTKGKIVLFFALLLAGFLSTNTYKEPDAVTVNTTVGKRELPIYCVDTKEKKIAITFDAAWGNEDTGKILEILDKHKVRATFFVTGGWANKYPEDVKKLAQAGHVIGNHSQNHKYMSKLSEQEVIKELESVKTACDTITGQNMRLFRPPYGDYDNELIKTATAQGYYTIQWDVDSLDWKDYGVDSIVNTVCNHKALGNGSIILMHNGAKYTKDALDTVITKLKEQGYSFVTVDELIYHDDFYMDANGRQHKDDKETKEQ